ncbi:hypothetical protein CKO_00985 [Citrobacter koseri ATCC BAA-895]|uniref:Uncharacterized protein n=1 Tax=Citrobacter koseri (strain ATCC BAA-895 / CDC 4225-83 / SGSC4696) TaxID=290338 RepID=A8AF68_CITK8|nr:hypothetical protein CKO_00985 [Citrobacter koseri ATCC BAA-895]
MPKRVAIVNKNLTKECNYNARQRDSFDVYYVAPFYFRREGLCVSGSYYHFLAHSSRCISFGVPRTSLFVLALRVGRR